MWNCSHPQNGIRVSVAFSCVLILSLPVTLLESDAYASSDRACAQDSSPEITIETAKIADNFYSDDVVITGRVKGRCLESAGVFEGEKQIAPISVERSCQEEVSKGFSVRVDASHEPEIRAYSCSGKSRRLKIDVLDYRG